ncbi:dihydroxy-acid dehydratase, partial [Rhizobium ruizarguesonis]
AHAASRLEMVHVGKSVRVDAAKQRDDFRKLGNVLPNDEKSRVRQLFAEGKVGRAELLEAESKSYHGPGNCTFYGTANSNQMLM